MAGRPRTTGSRLAFDEPLASDFLDFRAANYKASEMEVIREALREHIDRRLQETEMKNDSSKLAESDWDQPVTRSGCCRRQNSHRLSNHAT